MKLQDQLRSINDTEYNPVIYDAPSKYIKGLIFCDMNDSKSVYSARKVAASIERSKSEIDYTFFPRSKPSTSEKDLSKISYIQDATSIPWSWPTSKQENNYCMKSGLYQRFDERIDPIKQISNTITHITALQYCIDINQPLIVMQENVTFRRKYSESRMKEDYLLAKSQGGHQGYMQPNLVGLSIDTNEAFDDNARESYEDKVYNLDKRGIYRAPNKPPYIRDIIGSKPMNPFPSPEVYYVTPWAARRLLDNIKMYGMKPLHVLLSVELCFWSSLALPRYAKLQENVYSPVLKQK